MGSGRKVAKETANHGNGIVRFRGRFHFPIKKADPCIAQGPAHQNKTKNQLFILEGRKTAKSVNCCFESSV